MIKISIILTFMSKGKMLNLNFIRFKIKYDPDPVFLSDPIFSQGRIRIRFFLRVGSGSGFFSKVEYGSTPDP